eukprot:489934-Hanusia_phi.AAC.1
MQTESCSPDGTIAQQASGELVPSSPPLPSVVDELSLGRWREYGHRQIPNLRHAFFIAVSDMPSMRAASLWRRWKRALTSLSVRQSDALLLRSASPFFLLGNTLALTLLDLEGLESRLDLFLGKGMLHFMTASKLA